MQELQQIEADIEGQTAWLATYIGKAFKASGVAYAGHAEEFLYHGLHEGGSTTGTNPGVPYMQHLMDAFWANSDYSGSGNRVNPGIRGYLREALFDGATAGAFGTAWLETISEDVRGGLWAPGPTGRAWLETINLTLGSTRTGMLAGFDDVVDAINAIDLDASVDVSVFIDGTPADQWDPWDPTNMPAYEYPAIVSGEDLLDPIDELDWPKFSDHVHDNPGAARYFTTREWFEDYIELTEPDVHAFVPDVEEITGDFAVGAPELSYLVKVGSGPLEFEQNIDLSSVFDLYDSSGLRDAFHAFLIFLTAWVGIHAVIAELRY